MEIVLNVLMDIHSNVLVWKIISVNHRWFDKDNKAYWGSLRRIDDRWYSVHSLLGLFQLGSRLLIPNVSFLFGRNAFGQASQGHWRPKGYICIIEYKNEKRKKESSPVVLTNLFRKIWDTFSFVIHHSSIQQFIQLYTLEKLSDLAFSS